MPRKSAASKDQFLDDLIRLADSAFLAARKKAAALKRQKAEVRKAETRARNLRAMVGAMSAAPVGENGSYGFQRSHIEHDEWPWRAALIRRNMTVADYARQQVSPPLGVQTAKHWLKVKAKRPRQCPEFWALKIANDFRDAKGRSEVPAVDSSWPHGIKRG